MKSILDRSFRYVPASRTDVAATFRRIRAEQKRNQQERAEKVQPMRRKAAP